LILGLLFLLLPLSVQALEFESPDQQTSLIELFTSEGCSSCPPAEQWMNSLKRHSGLWQDFIPVAFHVDYWDYLGWKDPYATRANSDRQRQYRRQGHIRAVYTPGMLKNGREWRSWHLGFRPTLGDEKVGKLKVTIKDNTLTASYTHFSKDMVLNIVPLGFDILTEVKAGENRNRTLPHEFVALDHHSVKAGPDGWTFDFKNLNKQSEAMQAIAVWISRKTDLTPLQATGGWLRQDGQEQRH
jgi:hypothetical protein